MKDEISVPRIRKQNRYPSQSPLTPLIGLGNPALLDSPFGVGIMVYDPSLTVKEASDALDIFRSAAYKEMDVPSFYRLDYSLFPGNIQKEEYDQIFKDSSCVLLYLTPSCFTKGDFLFKDVVDYCKKHGIQVLPFSFLSQYAQQRFNAIYPEVHCLFLPYYANEKAKSIAKNAVRHLSANNPYSDFRYVKNAFAKRAFLSYRKKDRPLVDKVLDLLPLSPLLQGSVLWYDEMLSAGEIYTDEITEAIDASEAVIFLVTPNLFEKGNYVRDIEFPYSMKQNKKIVAISFGPVDNLRLGVLFKGMPKPLDVLKDKEAVIAAFEDAFGNPLPEDGRSLFLIGLAHENGYLVKPNRDIADKFYGLAFEKDYLRAGYAWAEMYAHCDYQLRDDALYEERMEQARHKFSELSEKEQDAFLSYGDPFFSLGSPFSKEDAEDPFELAFEEALRGNLPKAEEILKEDPSWHLPFLKGLVAYRNGDLEQAKAIYEDNGLNQENFHMGSNFIENFIVSHLIAEVYFDLGLKKEGYDIKQGHTGTYFSNSMPWQIVKTPSLDVQRSIGEALCMSTNLYYEYLSEPDFGFKESQNTLVKCLGIYKTLRAYARYTTLARLMLLRGMFRVSTKYFYAVNFCKRLRRYYEFEEEFISKLSETSAAMYQYDLSRLKDLLEKIKTEPEGGETHE